jgi:hypothetical protein
MLFFTKNKHIHSTKLTKHTEHIIMQLYNDIYEAYNYLNNIKKHGTYFHVTSKKLLNASHISKPQSFNSNSFPEAIRNHIDETAMHEITYRFSLYERNIKVHFILEEQDNTTNFVDYIDKMIMWIYILNKYGSNQCSKSLVVYLYFTSLEKSLPTTNVGILNEMHVNTAFTTTCPKDSEIIVYRKEEWFKVLIHETFHNFALDFSDMNNTDAHNCILDIFKVQSDVNLYEAYTEFWAEIINALYCSFFSLKNKKHVDEFLSNALFFIQFERSYSFFQLVKTLDFMGLKYKDLYSTTERSKLLRENLYKENTNVLAYYIIKCVLMNNFQGFLSWCNINNTSLLQFKKTSENQMAFCDFIGKNYKTSSMLKCVNETQDFFNKLHATKSQKNNLHFILTNMRMTICELG